MEAAILTDIWHFDPLTWQAVAHGFIFILFIMIRKHDISF